MAYSISDLINDMNDDLAHEYMHWQCYLHYAVTVRGLHRATLSSFFLEEARSEMKHIEEFARKIVRLSDSPGTTIKPFDTKLVAPEQQLRFIYQMEQERVATYTLRLKQCEELKDLAEYGLYAFYEAQLLDSSKTADHICEMLRSV